MKEEVFITNPTAEQLVEYFGGEIIIKDGLKHWKSGERKIHQDYEYRIEMKFNGAYTNTIILRKKIC